MDRAATARRRGLNQALIRGFWLFNLGLIGWFWVSGNWLAVQGGGGAALIALARLLGMVATFCALTQFVLMGRAGWLEPVFGLDRLALFHRLNGYATLVLVLSHPLLMSLGYALFSDLNPVAQYFALWELPYVMLASLAVATLVSTVGVSVYIVRKHLKFETWYLVHLANYAAVLLFVWHQFANGGDLLSNDAFKWYWISLYLFAGLNILLWRWIKPVVQSWRYDFRVEKTVPATPTATSVYISGRGLDKFKAQAGQFVMVRFWTPGLRFQEHPFSLSQLPNDEHLRVTVRQLGDFTNQVPKLPVGTRVIVSGPHGAFTHQQAASDRLLYIAGGIGITPIRSMLEERAQWDNPPEAVLLYANRSIAETALIDELTAIASKSNLRLFNVLSDEPNYKGEKGYIDKEKIVRLVPDVAKRDIFLCGPPPMMVGVRTALAELGVKPHQIHYERFALHKS